MGPRGPDNPSPATGTPMARSDVLLQTSRPSHGSGPCPLLVLLFLGLATGCTPPDPAQRAVERAIEIHGGERLDEGQVTFTFRGNEFRMVRSGGRFLYERSRTDTLGHRIREWMDNEGTGRNVDGVPERLDDQERARIETAVHSVVYFGFLPFRLQDPAVRLQDLGRAEVEGRGYRKVEVTFEEEGGGSDWEDRFVYWFHEEEGTLDYLAYRYHRDGGGTRFRRAVNRRWVDGVIVQDYQNFRPIRPIDDIADFDRLLEAGELELLSMVELEDVEISDPPPLP